jgi:hypothetical protein
MRIATEFAIALRHDLRMLGIPLVGPANMFCDNQSVVLNSTVPSSMLKKKHNAISYHKVRESIAAGSIRVAKEPTESNLADILTKPLAGPRFKKIDKSHFILNNKTSYCMQLVLLSYVIIVKSARV